MSAYTVTLRGGLADGRVREREEPLPRRIILPVHRGAYFIDPDTGARQPYFEEEFYRVLELDHDARTATYRLESEL